MSLRYSPAFVPFLAMVALCVAACDSATTSSVTTGPTPTKCQLTVGQPSNIVALGGTATLAVTAQPECAWTVSGQPTWISDVTPTSGQGNGNVGFRVAPNPVPSMREGEIVVNDNHVRVMQEAAPCVFAIAPDNQSVNASAGTANVAVTTLTGCTWTTKSNASWITITSGANGSGNGTATFSVASNGGLARTGTLTVASRTITVTQVRDPATCRYTLSPSGGSFAHPGGAASMSVSTDSDCSWNSTASAPWISITSGASGTGNGSVTYSVASNAGGLARSGTITVGFTTVPVTQVRDPATCRYSIDPGGASLGPGGGGGSINVSTASDCRWVVSVTSSWLVITSGSGGAMGSSSISWSAGPNTGPPRTAEILVSGLSFEVTQAGS